MVLSRKFVTPPLIEELFDAIAANGEHDADVVAFVKRFLHFAEQNRRRARRACAVPQCDPLVSSRPEGELRREIDELEAAYSRAYYARHLAVSLSSSRSA